MDLSEKAFQALDVDGKGRHAGRIYVEWKLVPAPLDQEQRRLDLATP
jgi:expansin (peptidoglycan-binding protein)